MGTNEPHTYELHAYEPHACEPHSSQPRRIDQRRTEPRAVEPRPVEPHGDRLARTEWLIAELRERADRCADPTERTNLHRSADALVRLATALQP